jgi:outer membrane biosynthesis protein TonB
MQLRQLIQPGITASLLAHLLLLGLIVLFSEVHPFGTVTAEPITVDLVTPDEVAKMPDEKKPDETKADEKKPDDDQPQLQLPKEDVTAPTPQAASPSTPPSSPPSAAAPAKQQQAAPSERREAAAAARPQPAPAAPPQATPPPMMPPAPQQLLPAYKPPEPDVTVKYGVMLGLPEALPPLASSSGDKPGDGIDATASSAADMSSSLIAKFRAHLKTCAKLPASVARSDNVFVKLRVLMTPQGKLATEPVLIEGSASVKALNLKQSAVQALSACQPYDMLPVDRYGEWKVLDLSFTPQDFG